LRGFTTVIPSPLSYIPCLEDLHELIAITRSFLRMLRARSGGADFRVFCASGVAGAVIEDAAPEEPLSPGVQNAVAGAVSNGYLYIDRQESGA